MKPTVLTALFIIVAVSVLSIYPARAQNSDEVNTFRVDEDNSVTSFKNIPYDIGRNLSGLFSIGNLETLLKGAGATGMMSFLDENEYYGEDDNFYHHHEAEEGSMPGEVGEIMGNHILLPSVIAGLAVTGQIIENPRFRKFSYSLVQGYIVNNLLTAGLKASISRTRPNQLNDRSFPSGHTSNVFTWATIAGHYYGKKIAIPSYALAAFIGWSRVNLDAHYLSDVIFGATIGYIVGRTVTRTLDRRVSESRFTWVPTVSSGRYGLVTSYSW